MLVPALAFGQEESTTTSSVTPNGIELDLQGTTEAETPSSRCKEQNGFAPQPPSVEVEGTVSDEP